jgi:hypothetical protein
MGTPGQKWCDAVTFCGTTLGRMTFGWTVFVIGMPRKLNKFVIKINLGVVLPNISTM